MDTLLSKEVRRNQPAFIKVKFRKREINRLLKHHTLQDLKQIAFQLVDFGLDAMKDYENKDGKKFVEISDKDICF